MEDLIESTTSGEMRFWYPVRATQLRDVLHWLPVKQRLTYKIAMMVFSCVRGTCPAYFSYVCTPVQTVAGRAKLRSARHGQLIDRKSVV